jgi:hypothetical protein
MLLVQADCKQVELTTMISVVNEYYYILKEGSAVFKIRTILMPFHIEVFL